MVKSNPRIREREGRRQRRLEKRDKLKLSVLPLQEPNSKTLKSQSSPINPLKRRLPSFSSSPIENLSSYGSFLDPKLVVKMNPLDQFPPLPPPPSKQLLRRTVSDPVPLGSPLTDSNSVKNSSFKRLKRINKKMELMKQVFDEIAHETQEENEKAKTKMEPIRAERLSEDWIMIQIKCGCGSDFQFLINEDAKKCYYELV